MSAFDQVDLALLPPPDIVETLSYEAILAAMVAKFQAEFPAFDALVESDPAMKLLQVVAYQALLLRQRVNDAARAVLLPTATGADLDNIAALFDIGRQLVDPGDPAATPPVEPVFEADDRLRRRVQLAPEAMTGAGTRGRYTFYALGASAAVADVAVTAHDPTPGDVTIAILANSEGWAPDVALLAAVDEIVQAEDVRQLCDTVHVVAATIIDYEIDANLTYLPGVAQEAAAAVAAAQIDELVSARRLGRDITRSAIMAALHVEGVHSVTLSAPASDLAIGPAEAARCTQVTLGQGGVDE